MDTVNLQDWVGASQTIRDVIDPRQALMMAQTLDLDRATAPGTALPPLWHWIYFVQSVKLAETGRDGHPKLGGFLPPVELPRRMYAGGRLTFHRPLSIGDAATRTSTVKSVAEKTGRSGPMVIVTVDHTYHAGDDLCVSEEQDIVYLGPRDPAATARPPRPAPAAPAFRQAVIPSPTLLFRYSALTFNGHRIHYDVDFCRTFEGYPGLVVHGPLLATYLAGLAVANGDGRGLATFAFKAVSPVFCEGEFSVNGRGETGGGQGWVLDSAGGLAMTADYTFA